MREGVAPFAGLLASLRNVNRNIALQSRRRSVLESNHVRRSIHAAKTAVQCPDAVRRRKIDREIHRPCDSFSRQHKNRQVLQIAGKVSP